MSRLRAPAAVAPWRCSSGVGLRPMSSVSLLLRSPSPSVVHSAKSLEHALCHLRCRGLGIGQGQDALRRGPRQQQAQDAIGQDVGFAGPRIGADPGGDCWDRRPPLGCAASPRATRDAAAARPAGARAKGRCRRNASRRLLVAFDRPFGDAGQMRKVIVVIPKARPAQGAVGCLRRSRIARSSDRAQRAPRLPVRSPRRRLRSRSSSRPGGLPPAAEM